MANHVIEVFTSNNVITSVVPRSVNATAGDSITFWYRNEEAYSSGQMYFSGFTYDGTWTQGSNFYKYRNESGTKYLTTTVGTSSKTIYFTLGSSSSSATIYISGLPPTPNNFVLGSIGNAELSTLYYSNQVTISGMNGPATASAANTAWMVAGKTGGWGGHGPTTVVNGDVIQLRAYSPSGYSQNFQASLTVGTMTRYWNISTKAAPPPRPNAFTFATVYNATPNATYSSAGALVSGGDGGPWTTNAHNGVWRIDAGGWITNGVARWVYSGSSIYLKTEANATWGGLKRMTITSGDYTTYWDIHTMAYPNPNVFSIAATNNAIPSTNVYSQTSTITGLLANADLTVPSGTAYKINSGSWLSGNGVAQSGVIPNNSIVYLNTLSPEGFSTTKNVAIKIGNRTANWAITNGTYQDPNNFSISQTTNATPSSSVSSQTSTITGLTDLADLTVPSGVEYKINSGSWTNGTGSIVLRAVPNNAVVYLRTSSPSGYNSTVTHIIKIGSKTASWEISNRAQNWPNYFDFSNVSGVEPSSLVHSSPVTIQGADSPWSVSVTGGEWKINSGGSWRASGTSSSIGAGNSIYLRVTSNPSWQGSKRVTVNVGGRIAYWDVVTKAEPLPDHNVNITVIGTEIRARSLIRVSAGERVEYKLDPEFDYASPLSVSLPSSIFSNPGTYTISTTNRSIVGVVKAGVSGYADSSIYKAGYITTIVVLDARPPITNPNPFSFTDIINSYPLSGYETARTQITGINVSVPVTTSGCLVSVNHKPYTSSTSISPLDRISLYGVTPAGFGSTNNAWVKVGDRTVYWSLSNRASPEPAHLIRTSTTEAGFKFKEDVRDFFAGSAIVGPVTAPTLMSEFVRGGTYIPDIPQNAGLSASAVGLTLKQMVGTYTYLSWTQGGGQQTKGSDTSGGAKSDTIIWSVSPAYVPAGTNSLDHPRIGYGNILGATVLKWELHEDSSTDTGVSIPTGSKSYSDTNISVVLSASAPANSERIFRGFVRLYIKHKVFSSVIITRDLPYRFLYTGP